ncbi:PREDICTED: putative F-box protein At1g58090 [Camelina sativa]|uniref:F-box protein At1g58090 n=1 Tax=Camelina sativa TaxID=90675 RepID=A0ABM0SQK7_CAMSA|nr:PREDICTED: putative F-box protein At1g58090 [Camelina sativa]
MVPRKLPSDLEEEILFRVPPRSLLRFKSVCREWYALFNNKRFLNKNFACAPPEFMLKTHTHIYSISVDLNEDPTIKVNDLCFDLRRHLYHNLYGTCDGYFFMDDVDEGYLVWNPLLRQAKRIAPDETRCGRSIGYDSSRPEKSFKIIGRMSANSIHRVAVFEFATNAWKVTRRASFGEELASSSDSSRVSLNGNLYWTGYKSPETGQYFIQMLDFSKEMIKTFCILPCNGKKGSFHNRVLSIYKGDRFSVLQQCTKTREIKIWVTQNKIGNGDDGDHVVWINFMTVSRPDFPMVLKHMSTSYFVDNNIYGKSFVLFCHSKKPKEAWVYIVRGDMCKKIKIDGVVCKFHSSLYVPSLITIS